MKRQLFYSSLCLLLGLGGCMRAWGQSNMTPPSPEGAALIRSINVPVSLSTGTANINVPLYTIKTRDFQIPITLNYQASGIKVEDVGTWVGLGWRLSTGGSITRIIRGKSDEMGYCLNDGTLASQADWDEAFFDAHQDLDGEPDLYYFEIPGNSGTFAFNSSGEAYTIPYQNIDIQSVANPQGSSYYVITDESGNKYIFNQPEYSESSDGSSGGGVSNSLTSWYLTEMKSAQGDQVTFTYETGEPYSYYSSYNHYNRYYVSCTESSNSNDLLYTTSAHQILDLKAPRYLKTITWKTGKIEFSSIIDSRASIPSRHLTAIDLYSSTAGYIKSFHLDYTELTPRRLHLWKLEESHNPSGVKDLLCYFTYNTDVNLPPRNSFEFDHWGYYNGPSNLGMHIFPRYYILGREESGADREAHWPYTSANILTSIVYKGGGKKAFTYEPNMYVGEESAGVWGGLRIKQIKEYDGVTDTPAVTEYVYIKPDGTSSGEVYSDKILYTSINTNIPRPLPSSFYYTLAAKSVSTLNDLNGAPIIYSQVKEILPNGAYNIYRYSAFSTYPDTTAKVGTPTAGGILPEPEELQKEKKGEGAFLYRSSNAARRGLLLEQQTYASNHELLGRVMNYYKQDTPIKQEIPCYVLDSLGYRQLDHTNKSVITYRMISQPILLDSVVTRKGPYSLPLITTYDYDSVSLMIQATATRDTLGNVYKTVYKYPQNFDVINGDSDMAKALRGMQRAHVLNSPVEVLNYKDSLMTGGALTMYKEGPEFGSSDTATTIKSFLKAQSKTLKLPQPIAASSFVSSKCKTDFSADSRYETQTVFENYDGLNNPMFLHDTHGARTSFLFGYNKSLPIAVVKNATATPSVTADSPSGELFHTSFEEESGSNIITLNAAKTGQKVHNGVFTLSLAGFSSFPCKLVYWQRSDSGTTWNRIEQTLNSGNASLQIGNAGTYIDEVRLYPLGAQMTTYTYLNGVGITSQTDANGQTTYYEYDALGRLSAIRNNDRHLVESYQYQ